MMIKIALIENVKAKAEESAAKKQRERAKTFYEKITDAMCRAGYEFSPDENKNLNRLGKVTYNQTIVNLLKDDAEALKVLLDSEGWQVFLKLLKEYELTGNFTSESEKMMFLGHQQKVIEDVLSVPRVVINVYESAKENIEQ